MDARHFDMHDAANLGSVRVVVFDLDDTLYPEHQYVQSGFRAVSVCLQEQGIVAHDVSRTMWDRFAAGERRAVFNRVLEDCGVVPRRDLIDELVAVYRTHRPDISLYPEARVVLDYFFGRKVLALLSDGYEQAQTAKLAALDIAHYFSVVMLTDRLGRDCWKPSTTGFEKIMQALGGSPSGYVYIGDNPLKDFAAPRRLGWQTVRIRRQGGVYADAQAPEESCNAAHLADDLYQAARLLDDGFQQH